MARSGEPALLLTLDIDHFKRVNDTHGHAAGDQVIQAVGGAGRERAADGPGGARRRRGIRDRAAQLPGRLRPARWPSASRTRVARQPVAIAPGEQVNVTVSVGGAFAPQWVRSTARLWMERADLQLYRAKTEGRNRCCLEPAAVSLVSAEEKGLLFASSHFRT